MYFWKVDKLVEDFKSGEVSQKEEFKYTVAFFLLTVIATDPLLFIDTSYNLYDSLNSIMFLAVTFWGVWFCYTSNAAGDNKDFIARMICIGWPVIIRLIVFVSPIIILISVVEYSLGYGVTLDEYNNEIYETTVPQVISFSGILFVYYVYLGKKIKAVAQTS